MITKQEDCASKKCQKKKVRNWLRWSQQRIWKVYCRIKINIFCLNVYFDLWWWFVQGVEWFKFACWQIWASQEHWKWEVIVWQDQRQSKHVKATRDIKRWRHVQINLVLRSHCFQSNHPHCIAFSTPWKQVVGEQGATMSFFVFYFFSTCMHTLFMEMLETWLQRTYLIMSFFSDLSVFHCQNLETRSWEIRTQHAVPKGMEYSTSFVFK